MTEEQKLHAFGRQLCMERYRHWSSIYADLANRGRHVKGGTYAYTDEAYSIFPRYNVAAAVLEMIERLNPDDLPAFEPQQRYLVTAAQTGASPFTKPNENRVHDQAMAEERDWLARHFREISPADIADQGPLFYRRVLDEIEIEYLRKHLELDWGATGYWYPLGQKTQSSLVAIDLAEVDGSELQRNIKRFLRANRVERLYEVREWGASYEIAACAEDMFYNGAEGFWIDQSKEWVVYCSHESTMTFGGKITEAVSAGPADRSTG